MADTTSDVRRLAELIVEVLEVGTRKADRLAGEFCGAFGIDLVQLIDDQVDFADASRERTRDAVVAGLVDGAPSPEALIREFAHHGSSVIAMLDEIYQVLAARDSKTSQTSEAFRFHMDGVDLGITISSAFLERVHALSRQLRSIEVGIIDRDLVRQFVRYDGGESYGSFPVEGDGARPLLHEVMLLRPFKARLRQRAVEDPTFEEAVQRCDDTVRSTESLLTRLEQLLEGFAVGVLEDHDGHREEVADDVTYDERQRLVEHQTLVDLGVVGGPVQPYFEELEEVEFFGMRVAIGDPLEPIDRPQSMRSRALVDRHGGDMSYLGAYLGIVRSGLTLRQDRWDAHSSERGRAAAALQVPTPEPAIVWLADVARAAEAAVAWIDEEVWTPSGARTTQVSTDGYEEFLNLPLWRQRYLLFEIWMLCRTIVTCEGLGWQAELNGYIDNTWQLPTHAATQPVATIKRAGYELTVWREPDRGVTPDVSIATPAPGSRDLVVLEAKDHFEMRSGLSAGLSTEANPDTALGVGLKYVTALGPPLTWVCNHSPFRGTTVDPDQNLGPVWHQIRLADAFGPGNVPASFAATLDDALWPVAGVKHERTELVIVLDTTSSMSGPAADVRAFLQGLAHDSFSSFSAILVGDHGEIEYVIRPVAPYPTPSDLREAIGREPRTQGGDVPEALEDAMRRAAWHATGAHQVFLVITDAPPHSREECPEGVDFREEVGATLATGASIWVVSDWLDPEATAAWTPFVDHRSFTFVTLSDLADRLARAG